MTSPTPGVVGMLSGEGIRDTNSLKTLKAEQGEDIKSINGPGISGLLYLHWGQGCVPVHTGR